MSQVIKVLVVDDSAYVRKVVAQMLSRSPFIEVAATARDGREALELAEEIRPDVITCDLNMPEMGGVAFVQAQMARRPIPIIIISVANGAGEQVLAALDAGAIDFLQKPTALASDRLLDMGEELIQKVKAAAGAPMQLAAPAAVAATAAPLPAIRPAGRGAVDVLLIGISTGGPQGLKVLIPRLPQDFPLPVCIVLHMPPGYTELYAAKLDQASPMSVKEAAEGDALVPGRVLLAPAGRHLTFRRARSSVVCHLDVRPLDTLHRPAVDVMFQSAAEIYGARTLGLVMTGMGSDGREGAAWIKGAGGTIWTEAESSCVVYGMPRAVAEAGLSDASFSLGEMAEAILEFV
jgi:two-component system, chemotaxis family, protein-glutamate methylesterase/glutaminase